MTDKPYSRHATPLTASQSARIDFARRDLETARAADLGQLDAAGLILLVERLRTRLDDTLNLVAETVGTRAESLPSRKDRSQ